MGEYFVRFRNDMKKYFRYAVRAARADLRSEVTNSFLDWLWWLIEPICMMLIYNYIFGTVLQASEQYFPIFIFMGLAMYSFFSRGIQQSVDIIRENRAIVSKIYMPKYILLLSRMFVHGFKMMVSFGLVCIMIFIFKVPITVHMWSFIPIIVILFIFTFGIGTILMHYGVFVSDLSYIVGILLNMLMYVSGIFYSVGDKVPAPFGDILEKWNPVAFLIASMRKGVLNGESQNWEMLALWTLISLVFCVIGIVTIYRNENSYVKVI